MTNKWAWSHHLQQPVQRGDRLLWIRSNCEILSIQNHLQEPTKAQQEAINNMLYILRTRLPLEKGNWTMQWSTLSSLSNDAWTVFRFEANAWANTEARYSRGMLTQCPPSHFLMLQQPESSRESSKEFPKWGLWQYISEDFLQAVHIVPPKGFSTHNKIDPIT